MFYVAAQENKKRQILRIKSQVSRLLTNKYNPADLSLKFCFSEEGGKGGGGGFQSHITLNFLSNHVSRVIFFFKPITRHVEGSKCTKLTL